MDLILFKKQYLKVNSKLIFLLQCYSSCIIENLSNANSLWMKYFSGHGVSFKYLTGQLVCVSLDVTYFYQLVCQAWKCSLMDNATLFFVLVLCASIFQKCSRWCDKMRSNNSYWFFFKFGVFGHIKFQYYSSKLLEKLSCAHTWCQPLWLTSSSYGHSNL